VLSQQPPSGVPCAQGVDAAPSPALLAAPEHYKLIGKLGYAICAI
jgi:hypothetical protein